MPEVELIQPSRLNLDGKVYKRGERVPVDFDVAYELARNPRFKVHGLDTRAALEHREKQTRPLGDDLMQAIRDAADDLSEDDDNYDRQGKPAVAALSAALGYPVTKEERDRALGGVVKAPQAGPGPIDTGAIKAAAEARKPLVLKKGQGKAADPHAEKAEEPVPLT